MTQILWHDVADQHLELPRQTSLLVLPGIERMVMVLAVRPDHLQSRTVATLREGYRHVHAPSEEPTPSAASIDSQTV